MLGFVGNWRHHSQPRGNRIVIAMREQTMKGLLLQASPVAKSPESFEKISFAGDAGFSGRVECAARGRYLQQILVEVLSKFLLGFRRDPGTPVAVTRCPPPPPLLTTTPARVVLHGDHPHPAPLNCNPV